MTKCKEARRAHVDQVLKWALTGVTSHDLREAVEEAFSGDEADAILAAVSDEFRTAGQADRTILVGFCLHATRDVYRRALEIGDFATALRAIKQMAQLSGR